ncbi:MAG TPA: serine hydrolase [Actinomycetales bacterium]|jgi:CubicO group peptidase (beta-lactamase class C family)
MSTSTGTTQLPRRRPSEQGVDARGVTAFVDAVEADPAVELHGLMVLRHGAVVAEGWWAPYEAQRPHLLYSLSKSFTATALGIAVDEGLVDLDATVLSYFPELDAEVADARSRAMRVRDVAAMASGHTGDMFEQAWRAGGGDLLRGFLRLPPEADPGSVFAYNQPCTFALSAIVQRVSGQTLRDYLRPRLLDPLGIPPVGWTTDPQGREIGFSGLHATTEAAALLGQLWLQRGAWQGRQLLSAAFVDEAVAVHADTSRDGDSPDWHHGYGFQLWRNGPGRGYRFDGAYGQFALVLPEHDAVVAITSASADTQALLTAAWTHLRPAFDDTEPAADASHDEGALATRLASAGLAALGGCTLPPGELLATPGSRPASLTAVRSLPDGSVVLVDSGAGLVLRPPADGGWHVDGPVASTAGRTGRRRRASRWSSSRPRTGSTSTSTFRPAPSPAAGAPSRSAASRWPTCARRPRTEGPAQAAEALHGNGFLT